MLIQKPCIDCIKNQTQNVAYKLSVSTDKIEKYLQFVESYLNNPDIYQFNPPMIAGMLYEKAKIYKPHIDLFAQEKENSNRVMLDLYEEYLLAVNQSENPIYEAIKIAVGGNAIDYAIAEHHVDLSEIRNKTREIIFDLDHHLVFNQKLEIAKTLLYIFDNAGEIVADKILIETLIRFYPDLRIVGVVRGETAFNDVTIKDAKLIGLTDLIEIIDTGSGIPSIPIEGNPLFDEYFHQFDMVLAKGQGNFETERHQRKVFYLFQVKCKVVSELLGIPTGGSVFYEKN